MSGGQHVLLLRCEADPDAAHAAVVEAIRRELPNLRWVASYRVRGSVEFVDVVTFQHGEDPAAAARAADTVAGVRAELMAAEPSALLTAPGGMGPGGSGPGGMAPGGAPGGSGPGGAPGGAAPGAP